MEAKDFVTILISLIAVAIALYGAFDSRRDARKHTRIRVSEIIDDLIEIGVAESEPRPDLEARAMSGWFQTLNTRREILCSMIEALLPEIPDGITEREYAALAESLTRIGDFVHARKYWEHAQLIARRGSIYEWMVLRGKAIFEFRVGNEALGRQLFESALTYTSVSNDQALQMARDTYLLWATAETHLGSDRNWIEQLLFNASLSIDQMSSLGTFSISRAYFDLRAGAIRQQIGPEQ